MTRAEFAALRERFSFACGYCGAGETGVGAHLSVDHFQPTSCQGQDNQSNWVYCCPACNSFKAAFWGEGDKRLLCPLRDDFSQHIEERDGVLVALTSRGQNHIEVLHLNREPLVAQRQERAANEALRERLRQTEEQLKRALERIENARRNG